MGARGAPLAASQPRPPSVTLGGAGRAQGTQLPVVPRPAHGGKHPRVGRPVGGCVNVRCLLDPSARRLTLGAVDVRGWAVLVLRAILCTLCT